MKKFHKYFYSISLFLIIISFIATAIYFRSSINNAFITPDETVNYTSLITFAKTFNFKVENKYSLNDNFTIVRPRGLSLNGKYLVPSKYFGMSFFYGFAYIFIKEYVRYITPIIGGVGILIMYHFVMLITSNKKTALLSAFLLAFFPPYFWWSRFSYMENIFGVVLFFFSFYLLTFFLKNKTPKYLFYASFFLGISCWVRPDYSVFVIAPLSIFLVFYYKEIGIKKLLLSAVIFSLTIMPVFIYNISLYGKAFTTGTHYALRMTALGPLGLKIRSLTTLGTNFENTLIKVCNLFIFSFIGLLIFIKKRNNYFNKFGIPYLFFAIGGTAIISYILLSGTPPVADIIIDESYTRYYLPLYLCILPGLSILITRLPKKIKLLTIISYLFFSFFFLSSQLKYVLPVTRAYAKTKENILKNTEINSIIFIDGLDKILYPDRHVASISLSESGNISQTVINTIINLIKYDKTTPIYIYKNSNRIDLLYITKQLQNNDISLNQTANTLLYKITINN